VISLVLGGARSGKSTVAEQLVERAALPVTYLATMQHDPSDPDLTARLDRHRNRRPPTWTTVEPPYDLVEVLATTADSILLDSLGPWAAMHLDGIDPGRLVDAMRARTAPTVVVSEEVGMGVHPETALGRRFRDELGVLNQAIAAVADECLLVVAGRVLRLERP
jgi:adenosylcobinamide kinase / adenosylcobinamide-phosphate guanylyltransferase